MKTPSLFRSAAVAASGIGLVALAPATAAARTGTAVLHPDTRAVSCHSAHVWVEFSDSAGHNCYTGNGSLAVSLHAVTEGQIFGKHRVCMTTQHGAACGQGPPGTFRFAPPANITRIAISS